MKCLTKISELILLNHQNNMIHI